MTKFFKTNLYLFIFLIITSCGSGGGYSPDVPTSTDPLIDSITPASGKAGDEISIKGIGFSDAYINNIIVIGDTVISASEYNLLIPPEDTAAEEIKFILPDNINVGDYDLLVLVYDNPSNIVEFSVTK